MFNQKGLSPLIAVITVLVIGGVVGGVYYYLGTPVVQLSSQKETSPPEEKIGKISSPEPDSSADKASSFDLMDWENPEEQFDLLKNPNIYQTPAKRYPKDFNECVEFWHVQATGSKEYLTIADKQKECLWWSNRKYSEKLLSCPPIGTVEKQTMCGDFICKKPFYVCNLKFENPDYNPPRDYDECLINEFPKQDCQRFKK